MHDLVIRNGVIVDGSGAPRFTGDVAIDGGLISAVGANVGSLTPTFRQRSSHAMDVVTRFELKQWSAVTLFQ